jgi:hypothetical protein
MPSTFFTILLAIRKGKVVLRFEGYTAAAELWAQLKATIADP